MEPTARALLDLLRPDNASGTTLRVQTPPPPEWDEIVSLAVAHGVAPLLHRALQRGDGLAALPEDLRARLEEERRNTALANLRHCAAFREIAQALETRNIPLIALKGLHLAEHVYRDISLRPMGDVDILVPRAELGNAVATLQRMEYGPEEDMARTAQALLETSHEIGLAHRRVGTLIELHWTLVDKGYGYEPPLEEIWLTAAPGTLADAKVRLMSPEFVLLHVCAHLACNHTFLLGLRGLCDIAEIVHAYPALAWPVVIQQGPRHGWTRGIAAALRLAHDHLGAAVPDNVLAAVGADTLDPEMLSEAAAHLLFSCTNQNTLGISRNVFAFADRRGMREKLAIAWRRVFMPRAELGLEYGVPEGSKRLPLYYVVRVRDLVLRYAACARDLAVSNPELHKAIARHARLETWIAGPK